MSTHVKLFHDWVNDLSELIGDIQQVVNASVALEAALIWNEHPSVRAPVTLFTLHSWQALALASQRIAAEAKGEVRVASTSWREVRIYQCFLHFVILKFILSLFSCLCNYGFIFGKLPTQFKIICNPNYSTSLSSHQKFKLVLTCASFRTVVPETRCATLALLSCDSRLANTLARFLVTLRRLRRLVTLTRRAALNKK